MVFWSSAADPRVDRFVKCNLSTAPAVHTPFPLSLRSSQSSVLSSGGDMTTVLAVKLPMMIRSVIKSTLCGWAGRQCDYSVYVTSSLSGLFVFSRRPSGARVSAKD